MFTPNAILTIVYFHELTRIPHQPEAGMRQGISLKCRPDKPGRNIRIIDRRIVEPDLREGFSL